MEIEVQEMLELGVIEPPVSPYSSPVVLVPKRMGRYGFVSISENLTRLRNSMQNQCRIWRK